MTFPEAAIFFPQFHGCCHHKNMAIFSSQQLGLTTGGMLMRKKWQLLGKDLCYPLMHSKGKNQHKTYPCHSAISN